MTYLEWHLSERFLNSTFLSELTWALCSLFYTLLLSAKLWLSAPNAMLITFFTKMQSPDYQALNFSCRANLHSRKRIVLLIFFPLFRVKCALSFHLYEMCILWITLFVKKVNPLTTNKKKFTIYSPILNRLNPYILSIKNATFFEKMICSGIASIMSRL